MPTVSLFFGIAIRMYFDEHGPPHFHAHYGSEAAQIAIDTLEILNGGLNRRARALVLEWALEHRQELKRNWALAEKHMPLNDIEPLS